MSYVVELLRRISQQMQTCKKEDYKCLRDMGKHLADDLLAIGCNEGDIPSVFLEPHECEKNESHTDFNALKDDVEELGGINSYLEYYVGYVSNQPSKGFMNEPVEAF